MEYIYLAVRYRIVNPPKPAVSIATWFILGIIISAIVWYWLKLRINKKRMDCIESFICNEIKYNRRIIDILKDPSKLGKLEIEQLLNSIKRDKEVHLTEYWSLLSQIYFFKRSEEYAWFKIWSSYYADLDRYISLYPNNPEPNDGVKILLSLLSGELVGKENLCPSEKDDEETTNNEKVQTSESNNQEDV